ncbi:ABC transporter ATP-binding protein [Ruminococcus sp. OA3]|uniref:ABC transporter ATP-binding protein n=1 Tax=Ruminococcus sp. OA3 TaxID=2914164 RepID=UPI001F058755|nr:ABC transporter ATP-binding protein [Ruminococcus sp. OA3]MCH1983194.1 ABC transporter ATP-binding protein [Ruminococcus sp. OA3]
MNALEIKGLGKVFGTHTVIDDLNLRVPQNCVFGFLGQNGAGKTTTMKMILGLLKPDSGEIHVFGERVSYGQTNTNRYIGFLPDVPEFYGFMKPEEYLRLCGEITGMEARQIKIRSDELLKLVGLGDTNKRISGFSRGMKQRLGIAQALLNQPRLLICDEPTSALDPLGRKEILDILEKVKETTTVLFSTHILSDVERICDDIAVLHRGRIELQGDLEKIRAQHRHDSIRVIFQDSGALSQFLKIPEIRELKLNTEISGTELICRVTDAMEQTEKILLTQLSMHNILPMKFEVLEPTLENMFMEVVG